MLYVVYSIFLMNFAPSQPQIKKNEYFKNLTPIENKFHKINSKDVVSYQKAPYLITKNHKISN